MQAKKNITYTLLLATAVFIGIGCSSNKIKIGVYGAFTGNSSSLGISMKNGINLAVDEINKSGGILGKKVVLIEKDDESKGEKGNEIVKNFIDKDKVVAILGPVNTSVADISTRNSNLNQVPHIITVSTGAKVNEYFSFYNDNYVFRVAANDYIQTQAVIKEAIDNRKYKKPAILFDETDYGTNGKEKLVSVLQSKNISPVFIAKFKIGETDMTDILKKSRQSKADVLIVWGVGPEYASISNTLQKMKWKVEMIGGWALSMNNYIEKAGINSNGAIMPQTFIQSNLKREKAKSFTYAYKEKYKETTIQSAVAAAQGYDAMYILKAAIEQAKTTNHQKIKEALESLNTIYEGVIETYIKPFNKYDHEAIDSSKVKMGVIRDGVIQLVEKK